MYGFFGLLRLRLQDSWMTEVNRDPPFPFRPQRNDRAEFPHKMMEHQVVSDDDPGMAVHRGADRHENRIPNFKPTIEDRFKSNIPIPGVKIQVWVFPEPGGSGKIWEPETPGFPVVVPYDPITVLPALDVGSAGEFIVVEHGGTPGEDTLAGGV